MKNGPVSGFPPGERTAPVESRPATSTLHVRTDAGFAIRDFMGRSTSLGTPLRNPPQAAPSAVPPGSDQVFKVALGGAPQKGSADAKVTIVEWSDFQCPFCSRAMDTLRQIEKTYGSDVRFVFKHNPLPMHPDAPYAATATIAAQKQATFWPKILWMEKRFHVDQHRVLPHRDQVLEVEISRLQGIEKRKVATLAFIETPNRI